MNDFTSVPISEVGNELYELVKKSTSLRLIRSGFTPKTPPDFLEAIKRGCEESETKTKAIRFILPSPGTIAMFQREMALRGVRESAASLSACLEEWYSDIAELRNKVSSLGCKLDLRKTPQPHRYHAFQGESGMLYGQAWHSLPSMQNTLFITSNTQIFEQFTKDFDWHWDVLPSSDNTRVVGNSHKVIMFAKLYPNGRLLTRPRWAELVTNKRKIASRVVFDNNGIIINRMGDALVAMFEDSEAAILAGQTIQRDVVIHNESMCDQDKLLVKIGISSGPVREVPDDVGSVMPKDILGECINIADQLQACGEPGTVHFCEATYNTLRPAERPPCERINDAPRIVGVMEGAAITVFRLKSVDGAAGVA